MKKVLTILLGIALIVSLSGVAAGDAVIPDGNQMTKSTSSQSTMVYYSITEENYVVVIPQSFSFSSSSTDGIIGLESTVTKGNITARSVTLKNEHNLFVNVTSTHGFKMVLHEDDDAIEAQNITYQMEYVNPSSAQILLNETTYPELLNNGEILVLQAVSGAKNHHVPLTFTMTGSPKDIGTFKDQLTFTASIRVA